VITRRALVALLMPACIVWKIEVVPPAEPSPECVTGECEMPIDPDTCSDGEVSGDESAIDCGGSCNAKCAVGQDCVGAEDCASGSCATNKCAAAIVVTPCTNEMKDADEADTDCGGICAAKCANTKSCVLSSDCESSYCSPTRACAAMPTQACATASLDKDGPVIFFTDLQSGPNVGGVDKAGVYLTIYGLRFGAVRGTSKVTIGGVEVAQYTQWNPSDPGTTPDTRFFARGIERIVVQPGPLVPSGTQEVRVIVNGKPSNAVSFTVRAGSLWFVDVNAGVAGNGSAATPWQHLYDAKLPSVAAGDVVYVKGRLDGQTITELDPSTEVSLHNSALLLTNTNAAAGTASTPVAYVGHPGALPKIGAAAQDDTRQTIFLSGDSRHHYVIANMQFVNVGSFDATNNGVRVVGASFINGPASGEMVRIGRTTVGTAGASAIGNYFYNPPRAIWVKNTATNAEVAWNEVRGSRAFGGINLEVQSGVDSIVGASVHDNYIADATLHGAHFAKNLVDAIVWNNLLVNNRYYSIALRADLGVGQHITIEHNTLVQRPPIANATAIIGVDGTETAADTFVFRNNLFTIRAGEPYLSFVGGTPMTSIAFDHNLFFGSSSPPPTDANAVTGEPILSAPASGGFEYGSASSPGIGGAAPTTRCSDYLGRARPSGAGADIGAFEWPD
jgi:hypothetical protein